MHSEPIVRLFRSVLAGTIQGIVEAYRIVPKAARPGDWPPAGVCRRRTVGTVRRWLHGAEPGLARLLAALPGSLFQTRERCGRRDRGLCGEGRPTGSRCRNDKGHGQLLESGRMAEGPLTPEARRSLARVSRAWPPSLRRRLASALAHTTRRDSFYAASAPIHSVRDLSTNKP